jgi:hypothetical protein
MRRHWLFLALVTLISGPLCARPASADLILDVTLDTTALTVGPGGPFSLFFQLIDGSGLGNADNTVTLSGFSFGSGGAEGSPTLEGDATGDLGTSVTLVDGAFFNAFLQGFTPGGVLSFALSITTNVDASGTPDAFAFSILDGGGFPLASLDPTLADTLMTIVLDSSNPAVLTYGSDPARGSLEVSAPVVSQVPQVSVPEPASLSLLLVGAGMAGLTRYSRERWGKA